MSKCFISHASADREFVEREVAGLLRAIGLDVWYAEKDIRTSEHWERAIASGLESTDWFVLVMSPRSASSEWVKDELAWAITHRLGRIVPIMLEECNPSSFHIRLPRIEYLDYRDGGQSARRSLIRMLIDGEYRPFRRGAAVEGHWCGRSFQDEGPDGQPYDYPITIALVVQARGITGHFHLSLPEKFKTPDEGDDPLDLHFNVTGGFMHERFVKLDYSSKDPGAVQFGTIVLAIDDRGREMQGKFVGYGARSKRIVSGRIGLQKSSPPSATAGSDCT